MIAAALALALSVGGPGAADAAPAHKKAIWGPARVEGKSQFPIYKDLGVGIYQIQLLWNEIAPDRPAHPTDPNDPAYRWPDEVDFAVREAPRYGIHVALQVIYAPPWANGGQSRVWAPAPGDFADFVSAAARRYRSVRHWMIWGEPSRSDHFQPLPVNGSRGPRIYSRLLDAAYGRLKGRTGGTSSSGGAHVYRRRRHASEVYLVHRPAKWPSTQNGPLWPQPLHPPEPGPPAPAARVWVRRFRTSDTLGCWIDRYLGRVHLYRIRRSYRNSQSQRITRTSPSTFMRPAPRGEVVERRLADHDAAVPCVFAWLVYVVRPASERPGRQPR